MSRDSRSLDKKMLRLHLERVLFSSPGELPEGSVGVDVEWLLKDPRGQESRPALLEGMDDAIGPTVRRVSPEGTFSVLPDDFTLGEAALVANGGLVSFGAGGQMRYATRLGRTPAPMLADVRLHVGGLLHRLESAGLQTVFCGMDPYHGPQDIPLQLNHLRPRLMDAYLESRGGAGIDVMRSACALQVRLSLGSGQDLAARLAVAERLTPIMGAIFANSPLAQGASAGVCSRRLLAWNETDAARTRPVGFRPDQDPTDTYLEYALAAPVMLRDDGIGGPAVLADCPTFGTWLEEGHPYGNPTLADWEMHLSTLFPPVRPRRAIELRAADTQNLRWFPVPVMTWWAILTHSDVTEWMSAPTPTPELLSAVAEQGIRTPGMERWAFRVFERAQEIVARELAPDPLGLGRLMGEFRRHFLDRRRMPADDTLDRLGNQVSPGLAMAR